MGYLGNTPGESFISFAKQVFTIVNSQTAYTLNFAVVDENELRLVINNVVKEPGTGKAYTASGTTLTLASALTNGTDEMYCVFLGKARETVTVPTITKDKLNLISNATAGLTVKGDGGSNDGYIALNCSQNSHAVKIKAPPHSAGQSYTLTLPQSITNNTFLKTDGSGNLSFASAGDNTPAWQVFAANSPTGLAFNANNTVPLDTVGFDTDSGHNTTTYKYTVPEAGKYQLNFQYAVESVSGGNIITVLAEIYNETTSKILLRRRTVSGGDHSSTNQPLVDSISGIKSLAANDVIYCRVYVYSSSGSLKINGSSDQEWSQFSGCKILGA